MTQLFCTVTDCGIRVNVDLRFVNPGGYAVSQDPTVTTPRSNMDAQCINTE